MNSFKKKAKKRDLGEYQYRIQDILVTPQYFPTQTQDKEKKEESDFGESSDRPEVANEEGGIGDL